jgi:hypothetical protein
VKRVYLGIIGTAGRGDDADRLTTRHFRVMTEMAVRVAESVGATDLVSGGAPWADHVAVAMALNPRFPQVDPRHLHLHLPAPFIRGGFVTTVEGLHLNALHAQFNATTGRDSMGELWEARERRARLVVWPGFYARNKIIGSEATVLLAFTFGRGPTWRLREHDRATSADRAGLADGGTAHAWNNCNALRKIHVAMDDMRPEIRL